MTRSPVDLRSSEMTSTGDAEQVARALATARTEAALFADVLAGVDDADLRAVMAAQADLTVDLLEAMAGRYNMTVAEVRAVLFSLLAYKREMIDGATRERRSKPSPLPPVVALLLRRDSALGDQIAALAAYEAAAFADAMSALARSLIPQPGLWASIEHWGGPYGR